MFDLTAVNIISGLVLILFYSLKNKQVPTILTGIPIFLIGPLFVYGVNLILYGITANTIFFINGREIMALSGAAFIYIGYDSYKNYFSKSK